MNYQRIYYINVHPNSQEQIFDESEDDSEDSIGADVPSLLYRVLTLTIHVWCIYRHLPYFILPLKTTKCR